MASEREHEIRFYHLLRRPPETALPILIGKTLGRGWRAVVRAPTAEIVDRLDTLLWTYDEESFLPHGSAKSGHAGEQPVWLTERDENPNGARVLFLMAGARPADPAGFELVCDLFDGRDDEAVVAARGRWKDWREAGHALVYYQEDDRGAFIEKARIQPR